MYELCRNLVHLLWSYLEANKDDISSLSEVIGLCLVQAFFFNTKSGTHRHENVRNIELGQNFLELGQILSFFMEISSILAKNPRFLTNFS